MNNLVHGIETSISIYTTTAGCAAESRWIELYSVLMSDYSRRFKLSTKCYSVVIVTGEYQ